MIDPYTQNWARIPMSEFTTSSRTFMKFLGIDVIADNVDKLNRVEGSLETADPQLFESLMEKKRNRAKVRIDPSTGALFFACRLVD